MSKWAVLKANLCRGNANNEELKGSIHRHDGFRLFKRSKVIWRWALVAERRLGSNVLVRHFEAIDCAEFQLQLSANARHWWLCDLVNELVECKLGTLNKLETALDEGNRSILRAELSLHRANYTPLLSECEYGKYDIHGIEVYTRENAPKRRLTSAELLSHRLHGVDNTGNVRVWFSEHVLLHVMLEQHLDACKHGAVLEIAAGMSGLCGLGIAAHLKDARVYLTDGHPLCAANLRVCVEMNRHRRALQARTRAMQLLWNKDDTDGHVRRLLHAEPSKFKVIVGADCLFFKDYHEDLVWTVQQLLATDGVVYLLQPHRGDSLRKFMELAEPVFDIELQERYNERVWELHQQYLGEVGDAYDPSVHYPFLMTLKHKKRGADDS